ncbi:hypothetical protein [Ruminococcus flavefaciens]|uniref:hypothetical protein n=1 Tax=Ruminococcus flavefaciens TaxID=1265 RepID=UPI0026E9DF4B|nr:hypothetical protein [Ruminococcus flavefaciens]
MKLSKLGVLLISATLMMCGCQRGSYGINYELPDEPIKFSTQTFVSPVDKNDTYSAIKYNDRLYIPYGTLDKTLKGDDVGACLGYIVQDGVEDKGARIYLLTATDDYLAEIFINAGMQQPIFFRAEDTIGKNIDTPSYIHSLNYGVWR